MSESASARIQAVLVGSGSYRYTITLTDTGTTPIGTFWYSWVPGAGYLPDLPSFSAPSGWAANLTDGTPPTNGYSIQWVASSAATALQPGQSFNGFVFTSSTAPSVLFGASTIHAPTPVDTSVVYSAGPFSDAGFTLVATPRVTRDMNADGVSDILFRNAAGVTYLWTMNGATVVNGAPTSVQVGTNWQVKGIADFNGDGTADILWAYNNAANASDPLNGVSYVSFQNGATATGGGVVQQLSSDWQVAGTGDFNGDGMPDVLYRNSSTGQTYLDIMNGASVNWSASGYTSQRFDSAWLVAGIGDFNGDGNADILWRYDFPDRALFEWQMNGTSVMSTAPLSQQVVAGWQVVGTGDFNGDGNADILLRYENAGNAADTLNGFTYIDFMNGTNILGTSAPTQWQVDNSWAIASIGDYNGDGMSDILWQQTATGNTYIWQMNGASVTSGAFTSQQAGTGWTVQNGVLIG